jgi:hypothetical protein
MMVVQIPKRAKGPSNETKKLMVSLQVTHNSQHLFGLHPYHTLKAISNTSGSKHLPVKTSLSW